MELTKKKFYAAIYGITILTALIPFAVIPFVTRTLSVENFARYNLAHSTAYLLLPIITLGMQTAVRKILASDEGGKDITFNECFSSAICLTLALSIFCLIIILLIGGLVFQDLFNWLDLLAIILLAVSISLISFIYVFFEVENRFLFKACISLITTFIIYSGILLLIHCGPMVRIYVQILVYTLGAFICLKIIKCRFFKPKYSILRKLLRLGLPLTLISLLELVMFNIDKFIILKYLSIFDLGIYTGYFYFFTLVTFGVRPVAPLLETFYYQKNYEYKKILYTVLFLLSFCFLIILIFHKPIAEAIYGKAFSAYSDLMAYFFFFGITKVVADHYKVKLVAVDRQKKAAKINLLIYSFGVLCLFLIIPTHPSLSLLIIILTCVNIINIVMGMIILSRNDPRSQATIQEVKQ